MLRDLAFPLIEPPHSRRPGRACSATTSRFRHRWRQAVIFDRTAYGRLLIDEPHRSHMVALCSIDGKDVRDDITRFEPFFLHRGARDRSRHQRTPA